MKFITYNSETIALCLAPPNWADQIILEINGPFSEKTVALSAQTSRRQFAKSARFALEYTVSTPVTADPAADVRFSTKLRLFLQRLKGEMVAVPLWTDGVEISAPVTIGDTAFAKTSVNPAFYGPEWIIVNPDNSIFEIVVVASIASSAIGVNSPGAALNWPAGTMMYPLLFGMIPPESRPKFNAETDEILEGTIRVEENSPFGRALNPFPFTLPVVGANISNFSTKKILNLQPQHVDLLDSTETDVLYRAIGFLRQQQQQTFAQANRRGLSLSYALDGRDKIAQLAGLFLDRGGPVKTFMCPTFRGDLRITQDLPISGHANQITVEAGDFTDTTRPAQPGDAYLALVDHAGVDPQKISLPITGTTLALTGSVSTAHSKSDTKLSFLQLSLFADPKLVLKYTTDDFAETNFSVIEQPDEYAAPQASLPQPGYLFRFTEAMPTPQVWNFTNYETSLTVAAGGAYDATYTPGPFDFGDVTTGTTLEEEKCEITSFDFSLTANPLRKLLEFSLEGTLSVEVLEVDVDNLAAAPKLLFSGDAAALDPNGKEWTATFRTFGQFFARQFPRFYFQRLCNVPVYSPKCGALKSDHLTDGTLYAFATDFSYIDIAQITGHPNPAAMAAHFFAIGFFETGTGTNFERRMIVDSATVSSKLRLYFAKPLRKAVLNQTVNIYPGCNGSLEQSCIPIFNNALNFRGFPYMPDKNPSADIGDIAATTGGKK